MVKKESDKQSAIKNEEPIEKQSWKTANKL